MLIFLLLCVETVKGIVSSGFNSRTASAAIITLRNKAFSISELMEGFDTRF